MKIDKNNRRLPEKTDQIWDRLPSIGRSSPIEQLRKEFVEGILPARENSLAAASHSLVLQELTRPVALLGPPPDMAQAANTLMPKIPIAPGSPVLPQGTPVLVIYEYFYWYLIAVMREPWPMGWVEKNDVRIKTDFVLRVNDEHYLETLDGRHFPRIAPYPRGYDKKLVKEREPKTNPPQYNIRYIIMHCTTGARMESTINHFKDPAAGVSTHLLIGRDGRVIQFLPFNRIAYHAGHSWWEMESNLNDFSIGIELDNAGRLRRGKDRDGRDVWMTRKAIIPNERVETKPHWKSPKFPGTWETFPAVQIEVALKIVKLLKEKYGIRDILGHDDVNLLNREDPGPLFTNPMEEWRQELFNRKLPEYKTFYLNKPTSLLRNYGLVLPNESTSLHVPGTLPADSEVVLIGKYDPTGVWTKISVKQSRKAQDLRNKTGWVKTNSLEPLAGKGQKGGRKMGNDKKAGKMGSKNRPARPVVISQFKTKKDQPFFKISGGEPTPRIPLEARMRVRRQEANGKWMQVVVLDSIGDEVGIQGWVKWDPELWSDKPILQPKAARTFLGGGLLLWQHKDDEQLGKLSPERWHPGDPAVYPLEKSAAARVDLTKQWQFFIRAINYGMPVNKVSRLFGYLLAFCNRTGLADPKHPRADFLNGENLSRPLPQLDKVRTCALAVMTGIVEGDHLVIEMMNGSEEPLLKDGCVYPERVEDVKIDIYKFTPRTHRHLFFAANITSRGGKRVSPFPGGAVYPWTGDGRPYVWMPHVAPAHIKIRYPLSYLTELPPGASIPTPYKP